MASLLISCQQNNPELKPLPEKDMSYKMFNEKQLEILGQPESNFDNLEMTYVLDLDTITKDSFIRIDFDSIYHIFQEVDFKFTSKDSTVLKVMLNTFSFNYYNNHKFKPSFLEVSYYSDDLLGLNLGSKEHGAMTCNIYEKSSGVRLAGYNKSNYDGAFFLGSSTSHDTFQEIRMVLKVDTLLYEQSFLTKDIDERTTE